MKRTALGYVLAALLAVGVLFVGVSAGSAASPTITFALDCAPAIVNQPGKWGCIGTVANTGSQAATHDVTVVQQYTTSMTVLESGFATENCTTPSTGTLSCEVFNLGGGDSVQFTTIFAVPDAAAGALTNRAYVSYDSGVSDGGGTGKTEVVCANGGAALPCATPETTSVITDDEADDKAGKFVTSGGVADVLATQGALAKAGDVLTEIQIPFRAEDFPNGFGATIVEALDPPADSCPAGAKCFGQTVVETLAGQFTTTEPARATFRLIAPNGKNEKNIVIYHDGVAAASCETTPLSATVDTCVESRSRNPQTKVVTIVVLSTDNGGWDFG